MHAVFALPPEERFEGIALDGPLAEVAFQIAEAAHLGFEDRQRFAAAGAPVGSVALRPR